MTRIDLVPGDIHARRGAVRALRRAGLRLGIVCAVAAIVFIGTLRVARVSDARLNRLAGEYSSLRQHLQRAETLLQERERLQRHRDAIGAVRGNGTAVGILTRLGEALPAGGHLTELELQLGAEPGLRFKGLAPGQQSVGELIRRLEASALGQADLISMGGGGEATAGMVEFELACQLERKGP